MKKGIFSVKRFTPHLLFILILVFAAIFRVTNLNVIEFKSDEAINLFLASRPLFGHPFPPGGTVSSIGILNPPLFNYLLFPFTLLTLDPKIISFFIGLLNSFAIGFYFLLIRRYYGLVVAFTASSLLALSPWSILFSRKIWSQDLLIIFLIPLIYSVHKLLIEKKNIYWIAYVALSMLIIQLHQASIFFITPLTIFLIFKKTVLNFKYIALGFLAGALPLIPYLAYILGNLHSPTAFLVDKERFSPEYFPITFLRPLQIMSQGNFYFILGDDMLTFAQNFPLIYKLRQLFYLEYLILPFGVFLFWKNFPKLRFLVYVALGLPVIYFLLHIDPFMHYFIILIPLLFLFLAHGFSFFLRQKNILLKGATLFSYLALIIVSFSFNFAFFKLLNSQKMLRGDYGTSFTVIEQDADHNLQKYRKDKDYPEMLLASYIPQNVIYGFLPVAKMIYPPQETEKRLNLLTERLKEAPDDSNAKNELLAFYTSSPPTAKTAEFLRKKAYEIPGYRQIYDGTYRIYLEQNHKKLYAHPDFGFAFEYPETWYVEERPGLEVIVSNRRYYLFIKRITNLNSAQPEDNNLSPKTGIYESKQVKVLGETLEKKNCKTINLKWCGITYSPIEIGKYQYKIMYTSVEEESYPQNLESPNGDLDQALQIMDQIAESLRHEPPMYSQ